MIGGPEQLAASRLRQVRLGSDTLGRGNARGPRPRGRGSIIVRGCWGNDKTQQTGMHLSCDNKVSLALPVTFAVGDSAPIAAR